MKTLALYALTACLGLIFAVLKLQYGMLDSTIQALLIIAIALPGALAVARTLEYLLFNVALDRQSAQESSDLHRLLLRLVVYATATLLVLRFGLEQDITGLLATSAVLSVVLGLALQPTLGNLLSGIALEFERPVRIGDYLQVVGMLGRVQGMNWRSVVLETADGTLAVVPNSQLTNHLIEVRKAATATRFHLFFSVPGWVPPSRVIEIAQEVLRQPIRDLAQKPAASVILQGVEAFSGALKYDLRYCTTNVLANKTVGSDVLERLWYALDRADIPMTVLPGSVAPLQADGSVGETAPYETALEMIRRVDSAAQAGASPDALALYLASKPRRPPGFERKMRLLKNMPLFSRLDEESLDSLLMSARRLRFTRQEPVPLVVSGVGELRLILSGSVRVFGAVPSSCWSTPSSSFAVPSRDVSASLFDDEIEQIVTLLVPAIGPIAEVLVRNAAETNCDRHELFHRLSEVIPEQDDRERFLANAPTAPITDFGQGTGFGEWSIACGDAFPACIGTALDQTDLLVVPAESLSALLQSKPDLVDRLVISLSETRADLTTRVIAERIAQFHQLGSGGAGNVGSR